MKNKFAINKIYPIDCLQGLKSLDKGSVDVIVTSPPYNIGINYNLYNDNKNWREYSFWMNNVAQACKRVLNDNGSFFFNIGGALNEPWFPIKVGEIFGRHFVLQNMIHWIKSIAIPKESMGNYPHIKGDVAVGHYKPINSRRYHHDSHEFIFHFTKTGSVELEKLAIGVPYQDKSNVKRWKSNNGDRRDRGNTWFIPYETIQTSRVHPSVFPVCLPEMCIMDHGVSKTRLVLDPFMGIGSTAIACIRLGVDYIGFEIDPDYVKIANGNIESELQKKKKIQSKGDLLKFIHSETKNEGLKYGSNS